MQAFPDVDLDIMRAVQECPGLCSGLPRQFLAVPSPVAGLEKSMWSALLSKLWAGLSKAELCCSVWQFQQRIVGVEQK